MKFMAAAVVGALVAAASPVLAEQRNGVLVELYTSQGCSSCPPADEILGKLAGDARLIPLSLHVDYWDYLGWKDKFSDAKFTNRQRDYAAAAHDNMIYTPQIIVAGGARMVGSRGEEIARAVSREAAAASPVALTLSRTGDTVAISAKAVGKIKGPLQVQLVRFIPAEKIAIKRGENAGQTITYRNIVTSWTQIGDWSGSGALSMSAAVPGNQGVVVVVQAVGPGPVLAAAELR